MWADSIFVASEDSISRRTLITPTVTESAPPASSRSTVSSSRKAAKPTSYHKVRRGETLTSIAATHGTTVKKIKKLNGLKSDKIRYGQRLKVR